MSIQTICDSCKRIIYDDPVVIYVEVINRYNKNDRYKASLHLCEGCDTKVAKALLPLLPSVAYIIEPNVNVNFDEVTE